jgi:hypothetical protein
MVFTNHDEQKEAHQQTHAGKSGQEVVTLDELEEKVVKNL